MALTLTGSAGQTGSLVLTDSDINNTISVSLAGTMSVATAPANIPANTSDSNWNTGQIYSTSIYRSTVSLTTSATTLTWASIGNALCQTGACSKVNVLYIKNLGAEAVQASWSSKLNSGTANSTTDYMIVPPYGILMVSIPMNGLAVTGTTGLTLKTGANTTSAYVVIAHK